MKYKILATTSSKYLLNKIKSEVLTKLFIDLKTEKFSDGEIAVKFPESVRGCHLFLFCDTSKPESLIELMLAINAAHLSAAKCVTLIVPYFGYCRQDRQEGSRGSLGAALIAKMITSRELSSVVDRVVTIDLHAEQEQGFFNTPCEHLRGHSFLLKEIKNYVNKNTVLCSPDAGGMKRVEKYMTRLQLPMVTINKSRKKPNEVSSMELSGNVLGKEVIIIDDIVDTCGTLKKAVNYLKKEGATKVIYVSTHPVLSGKAFKNLSKSKLDLLIISDTIDLAKGKLTDKIKVISCMPMIEKVISNLIEEVSVSVLNEEYETKN